jgi:hypothetical protein
MKKTLLTFAVSVCAISVFAQGTVNFNNRNTAAGLFVPIYGPNPGVNLGGESKTGNSSIALPAGTQTYAGALLTGSGYLAQLFAAPGAGAAESALVASANSITTFRTGTSSGAFAGVTAVLANVLPDAAVATLQVRAWDNTSGLYPTWALAEAAWLAQTPNVAIGKSPLFDLNAIGGNLNTPPLPVGMQSFNIYMNTIPEPSTFVLAGLGAASLLIFRRRK